jgi:flagellar motility protein MotE (MotC chaperone)
MARFYRIRRVLRVFPATIFALALLLGLKLVGLGDVLMPSRSMITDAQAAPAHGAAEAAHGAAEGGHGAAPPTPVSAPVVPAPPAEPSISMAERQLLQDLRGRRTELDTRERLLQQRETVLDAAEHRLTARIAELAALQTRLEDMEKARQQHIEANWAGLVKVYETMKPKEAATIFNEMDMPVLLQVMDRMKDAKAALILGAMQPDRARSITAQLAAMRTHSTAVPPDTAG